MQDLVINLPIFIGNLNIKQKILFMPSVLNIQMKRPKNAKYMIFPKTGGQKFVILSNQGTTTQ
jgi:hypothetical protein